MHAVATTPVGLGQYPYGWDSNSIAYGASFAKHFGMSPRDLFAVWYNESGLNPRAQNPYGNSGLAQSTGGQWVSIVQGGTVEQQIDAIGAIYNNYQAQLGESLASRASRIGTTPAALVHAMMTLPATAAQLTSATQPFLVKNGAGYSGMGYSGNPCFDHEGKGYANLRDYENNITAIRALSEGKTPSIPHCLPLGAPGWSPMPAGARAIFAALPQDSLLSGFWRKPAGKATIVVAGGLAALATAFYVKYGRLPTRRDIGV